jgi:hypothetical protein
MKFSPKPATSKKKAADTPSPEGLRALKGLKMAVAGVIEEHRRLGLPIAVMRNGKAVFVDVDKNVSVARETKAAYRTKR